MQPPRRDRSGSAIAAVCVALLIAYLAIGPAAALTAGYTIFPNGTAYQASIEIADASRFEFADSGILGEPVPVMAGDIRLTGNCSPCRFNTTGPSFTSSVTVITFEQGNYTVSYVAPIRDNHLQAAFRTPYNISVTLPPEFSVQNPLLAAISPGANITRSPDNTTVILWDNALSADLRFYDMGREALLYFFLQFMVILAVVMLLPFLLSTRKKS